MFRADKIESLEVKVNAWLNENGTKINKSTSKQSIFGSDRLCQTQRLLRY